MGCKRSYFENALTRIYFSSIFCHCHNIFFKSPCLLQPCFEKHFQHKHKQNTHLWHSHHEFSFFSLLSSMKHVYKFYIEIFFSVLFLLFSLILPFPLFIMVVIGILKEFTLQDFLFIDHYPQKDKLLKLYAYPLFHSDVC